MTIELLLPDVDDAGLVRRWYLPVNGGDTRGIGDPEHYPTYARFLGLGTSHTAQHSDHVRATASRPATRFVERGERCNACRWFEARIFREVDLPDGVEDLEDLDDPRDATPGAYVVHYAGMSIVDGEVPLYRLETTRSPYMVIESMTTRRVTDSGPQVFLAKPSAHALATAAGFDRQLREAYLDRAVT